MSRSLRGNSHLFAVLLDSLQADALDVGEFVDRLEGAVFLAVLDDGFGLGGADAVQRFELGGAGRIEVDLCSEGGERSQRQRQAEDEGFDEVHGVISFAWWEWAPACSPDRNHSRHRAFASPRHNSEEELRE